MTSTLTTPAERNHLVACRLCSQTVLLFHIMATGTWFGLDVAPVGGLAKRAMTRAFIVERVTRIELA
jgi:hypothetical protein